MDQSFDPFNGGYGGTAAGGFADTSMAAGGNDTSFFGGTQVAPKINEYDKVCIPVTVATLNTIEQDQKVQFGNYQFSTVRVVAQIVQVIERPDGGAQTQYLIRDYGAGEDQEPFTVIVYHGVDFQGQATNSFIEGTTMTAIGKVNSFDGKTVIVAFKVLEVVDMGILDVFPKEARLAELYFTKNVPEIYQSGRYEPFLNTMLSPEAPTSNNKQAPNAIAGPNTPARTAPPANAPVAAAANSSSVYQSSQRRHGRGANPQQDKIIEYLMNFGQNEEGQDFDTIRNAVRGNAAFEADINALASNGVIYTTISDSHYAIIMS